MAGYRHTWIRARRFARAYPHQPSLDLHQHGRNLITATYCEISCVYENLNAEERGAKTGGAQRIEQPSEDSGVSPSQTENGWSPEHDPYTQLLVCCSVVRELITLTAFLRQQSLARRRV